MQGSLARAQADSPAGSSLMVSTPVMPDGMTVDDNQREQDDENDEEDGERGLF